VLVLPLVPLVLLSCASGGGDGESSPAGSLGGVTWVLDSASMGSLVETVPSDARVDLRFDGERANGRAACNSYGGPYAVDGEKLSFGSFAVTLMACEPPLMDLESAYLTALGSVDGYQVAAGGRGLVLTGGNVALTFVAEEPVTPLPLTGTTWRLTTIATGTDAVSSTIAGTEVTAVFGDDGRCRAPTAATATTGRTR
jgi:heat shock protein HslJ